MTESKTVPGCFHLYDYKIHSRYICLSIQSFKINLTQQQYCVDL